MASFLRFARQSTYWSPALAVAASSALASATATDRRSLYPMSFCQSPEASIPTNSGGDDDDNEEEMAQHPKMAGMQSDVQGDFHGLFPKRQLFQPKVEWPLWDNNWDNLEPSSTGDRDKDKQRMRQIRKQGVTRHIILIRHGQYDETHREDEKRILTDLGRKQAHETGLRLAQMLKGIPDTPGGDPCNIRVIRVSNLARAKETADIIASHLPNVEQAGPDELLNEGRPCHNIPGASRADPKTIEKTDEHHPRIEAAFQKYFYRAPLPASVLQDGKSDDGETSSSPSSSISTSSSSSGEESKPSSPEMKHEYEIVVCHANVIRYFLCRALQLPPEAWLRLCTFNCSLTYLTIRPTGTVSCRMLGDIGHLPPELITFSGHHGFNW